MRGEAYNQLIKREYFITNCAAGRAHCIAFGKTLTLQLAGIIFSLTIFLKWGWIFGVGQLYSN